MTKAPPPSKPMPDGPDERADRAECFIIMPISSQQDAFYTAEHFQHVYDDLIRPACDQAGYKAIRADDVRQANMIHLDILERLLQAPLAICDLSSRNPNVLFELGVRQAFDKPTVLIKDNETTPIFDIAPLRILQYSREMKYHQVIKSQKELQQAIQATVSPGKSGTNINSIVTLLKLGQPAKLPDVETSDSVSIQLILAEVQRLRADLDGRGSASPSPAKTDEVPQFENLAETLRRLDSLRRIRKVPSVTVSTLFDEEK